MTPPVELTPPDPCTSGNPSGLRRQFCAVLECGQIAKSDDGARIVLDWLLLAERYTRAAVGPEPRALSHEIVEHKVYQAAGNLKRIEQGHGQRDIACIERQQAFLPAFEAAVANLKSRGKPGATLAPDVREFLERNALKVD